MVQQLSAFAAVVVGWLAMVGYLANYEYLFYFSLPRGVDNGPFLELPAQGLLATNQFPQFPFGIYFFLLLVISIVRAILGASDSLHDTIIINQKSALALFMGKVSSSIEHALRHSDSFFRKLLRAVHWLIVGIIYYFGFIFGLWSGDQLAQRVAAGQALESQPAQQVGQRVRLYLKSALNQGETHAANSSSEPKTSGALPYSGPFIEIWQTNDRIYVTSSHARGCTTYRPSRADRGKIKRKALSWVSYQNSDIARLVFDRDECADYIPPPQPDARLSEIESVAALTLGILAIGWSFIAQYRAARESLARPSSTRFCLLEPEDFRRLDIPADFSSRIKSSLMGNRNVYIILITPTSTHTLFIRADQFSRGFMVETRLTPRDK